MRKILKHCSRVEGKKGRRPPSPRRNWFAHRFWNQLPDLVFSVALPTVEQPSCSKGKDVSVLRLPQALHFVKDGDERLLSDLASQSRNLAFAVMEEVEGVRNAGDLPLWLVVTTA